MERKKILIVDDEQNILKALSLRFKAAGYDVVVAMDALQAVMMTHRHNPDLMILDIRMPGGGGLSVLEKLKSSIKTRNIPVIVASAFDDDETRLKAKELGAVKFFRKPFDTEDLIKAVEEELNPKPKLFVTKPDPAKTAGRM